MSFSENKQSQLSAENHPDSSPKHESSKKSQSFLSSVFSSHKPFSKKHLFSSGSEDKQWTNEKGQGFFSSVIHSNQGLLTDLSSRLEAALSLSLDALDSDSSSKSDETSCKNSTINELSNSSSQVDIRRISLPVTKTEQIARHRYSKRRGTRHKDRSVYGQPEIAPFEVKTKSWKDHSHSQESLDTVDSGQSLGNCSSLSASGTDYRSSKNDPFYVFRHTESLGIGSESDPCGQSTSLDSSDAESIPDGRGFGFGRSASGSSLHSWASSPSNDSQPDDITMEAMEFMKRFVKKIFFDSVSITFEEKAKFGELCRYEIGRLWFGRCVNGQRVHNKLVKESTFYSLVQYFAIVLFECAEADDFSPAKSIMNMCFTFYHERISRDGRPSCREYLFSYLKDQPIWRSIRFWNAAFFDAVQCERANREIPTRDKLGQYSAEDLRDEKKFQENIFFGQLGTFTYNMYAFGLSKEFAMEFLRKQCIIASLSKEHVLLLRENIDRMYSGSIGNECS
ncbi:uncharacterized protein KIAA0513-like [Argiope bruennichi]|uniref:uncharacterized protein KIAA0513-like n=1 Tax=Argiope bruennichi TaxID=94029 RepID=UPI0024946312|nr:uncharacterized protein KIAA0513-like [Argiope bruennichi]XP_055933175.1 uncharacterized protein KIAA0513-like [Argiope bruennichi]XP_055933176.1 uncharacterized protein KIAA0513-like [Argiope bruennichi]